MTERLLLGEFAMQTRGADLRGCMGVIESLPHGLDASAVGESVLALWESSRQLLIDRLREFRDNGDLPDGAEPEALARYFRGVAQGLSLRARTGATDAELRDLVCMAVKLWPAN
jgi:hypothetical protein